MFLSFGMLPPMPRHQVPATWTWNVTERGLIFLTVIQSKIPPPPTYKKCYKNLKLEAENAVREVPMGTDADLL